MPNDTLTWTVQNTWPDRGAVWVMDLGGPKEACRWTQGSMH